MKHLKLVLKSLINNNSCIECARTKQVKYNIIAIFVAMLALFFSVLPNAVSGFQQQGSAWINSTTYNIENGLQTFGNEANTNSLTIELKSDKTIKVTGLDNSAYDASVNDLDKEGNPESSPRAISNLKRFAYLNNPLFDGGPIVDTLEIYMFDDKSGSDLQKMVTNLLDNLVPECPADDKENENNWLKKQEQEDGSYKKLARQASLIVFGKDCYYAYLFNPTSTGRAVASTYGDYHHMEPTNDLIKDLTVTQNNIKETLNNWKKFCDLGFIDTRYNGTWRSTLIILGINAGVMLLMGFMVWIMTRGKNNPFRIYTLWETQKISYYASLTPGILALFGFLIPSFSMMLFVMGDGIRMMWLSMKTLKYQAPSKK